MDSHAFERDLHRRMAQWMEIDEEELMARVRPKLPVPADIPQDVEVCPVQTYVEQIHTAKPLPSVMVPAFAVHWAVVVDKHRFHLTFRDREDGAMDSKDPFRNGASIKFHAEFLDDYTSDKATVVGQTKYSHRQLCRIGVALIEAFGDYHRLFWNCQMFANCFLRIITGGREFDRSFPHEAQLIVDSHLQMPRNCSFAPL
jgi:hypothetical protein